MRVMVQSTDPLARMHTMTKRQGKSGMIDDVRTALIGLTVIVFFIALSILAPICSPYDPLATNWAMVRKPPSMLHLFGTDEIGRHLGAHHLGEPSITDGRHRVCLVGGGNRG